jgi:HPt (histidine-containing phosphotransfer) domain-containing protein
MIETKINIQALRQRTANDKDLMLDLLGLMNVEKYNYQSAIQNALSEQDLDAVLRVLHKLKSAVAVLGFDLLADRISIVEKNALKKVNDFNYAIEINFIFISLNYHLIELENYLKK